MIRVRFAPSPTGYIHIGNSRIALANWLFALEKNGEFILRYDDTDVERSRAEYVKAIAEDLVWLGIKPAETYFQSQRFDRYDQAAETLKKVGLLYPCYETSEELERRRKILLSRKLPPIYGREALKLTPQEREALEAQGRKPHWRFLLPNFDADPFTTRRSEVHWQDLVRGPQKVDLASLSDPVLIRADGSYLYTLPSIVDDHDMGVSHIIRGDDHITNTGVQIALFEAMGTKLPSFGHINLLTTASGEGLSKRKGDLSLRSLREQGFEPMAVASLAVLTGTAENVQACADMAELTRHFSFSSISKSAAKFDPQDLVGLNRQLIHNLDFDAVKEQLKELDISAPIAADFWTAIRENLNSVEEASKWWVIVTNENLRFDLEESEHAFLEQAAALLPPEPWDKTTWRIWTSRLKEKTGRKGKALFHPLRLALTGETQGPELASLLPLIGHSTSLHRLVSV